MSNRHSFRFLNNELNDRLIQLFKRAEIQHRVDRAGLIRYSTADEEVVENDLIRSVRDSVFPSWQVLTCPSEWTTRYRDYLRRNDIPFQEELVDGELWFLIPRKYRPGAWKLEDPSQKRQRSAVPRAS
jgi:hypothetical protein